MANLSTNTRVVDKEAFEKLADRIADFGKEAADQHLLGSHAAMQGALQRYKLTADALFHSKDGRR